MSRVRDSQRSKVYAAEDFVRTLFDRAAEHGSGAVDFCGTQLTLPPEGRFGSVASAQRYVDDVLALPAVRQRWPGAAPLKVRARPAVPSKACRIRRTIRSSRKGAERGYAAFYSESLEGHTTACGGTYNSRQLTAAHPKLRCGTKVRVTNLRNGKTVRVTINDRGPLSHGDSSRNRIIDLSYAAARRLDFISQGSTLVKVEVIR